MVDSIAQVKRGTIIAVCGAGSVDGVGDERAFEVGRLIAESGSALVCGGLGGSMESSCRGAKSAGGITIGILPTSNRRDANPYVDFPIATGMGHARNAVIVQTAHVVIALPGGAGTHSEIALSLKVGTPVVALDAWDDIRGIDQASTPRDAVGKALELAGRNAE